LYYSTGKTNKIANIELTIIRAIYRLDIELRLLQEINAFSVVASQWISWFKSNII